MSSSLTRIALLLTTLLAPSPEITLSAQNGKKPKTASYVIAVHPKNQIQNNDSYLRRLIKQFYLKKLTSWPDGTMVRAYGRKAASVEQAKFQASVLSMTGAEIARHWLRQKSQRGLTPPKGISSDRMAVKYVKKHRGAFTIMRADVAKKGGLRVLLKL